MKRLLLKALVLAAAAIAVIAIGAWAAGTSSPGGVITLATFACLVAGLAFGKLEAHRG